MKFLKFYIFKKIPENIIQNICDQIRPHRPIPKCLNELNNDEIKNFPRLFEWYKNWKILFNIKLIFEILYKFFFKRPKEFVIDDLKGSNNEKNTVKID